jgi:hypothetical protein
VVTTFVRCRFHYALAISTTPITYKRTRYYLEKLVPKFKRMNLVDKNLPDYCLDFYGLLVNIFAFIVNKIVFSQIKSYNNWDGKKNSILCKHFNGLAIKSY